MIVSELWLQGWTANLRVVQMILQAIIGFFARLAFTSCLFTISVAIGEPVALPFVVSIFDFCAFAGWYVVWRVYLSSYPIFYEIFGLKPPEHLLQKLPSQHNSKLSRLSKLTADFAIAQRTAALATQPSLSERASVGGKAAAGRRAVKTAPASRDRDRSRSFSSASGS